jgi:cholesterol oxidase
VILERGQEWLPGDFPEDLKKLVGAERKMDPNGLYDLYAPMGSDLDIISASGVGGTSLINAAISSRPVPSVFTQPEWPEAIRAAHADGSFEAYFQAALAVLQPNQWAGTAPIKVARHRDLAGKVGQGRFDYLPLNVTYDDAVRGAPNRPVQQYACKLCGNCTTGCNHGAKSTLQTSYLPLAVAHGARIYAGIDVRRVEKRGGSWRVHYTAVGKYKHDHTLDADHVVIAAGALGTSELLLRSRARGLALSDALGTRVSANGDLAAVSYNGSQPTRILGEPVDGTTGTIGNALMGYVDYRAERARGPELQDQFLLIESTIPVGLANTAAKALVAWAGTHRDLFSIPQKRRIDLDMQDMDKPHREGALAHTTLYLACGHDDSGGRYVYQDGDRPRIVWPGVGKSRFVEVMFAEMKAFTELQGGVFIPNPRTTLFGGRIMVPHPLGGAPMGEDARTGVVDHLGRVFDPAGGLHRGLHVLDGSIIPRSLAATPLLTICALAERGVEHIAAA